MGLRETYVQYIMRHIHGDLFIPSEKGEPRRVNHWALWTYNKLLMDRHGFDQEESLQNS